LEDTERNASFAEKSAAPAEGWNVLVMAEAGAEKIAEFIILPAEAVRRVMIFRLVCQGRLFRAGRFAIEARRPSSARPPAS
jgi:hypothetical protein